MEPGKGLVVWGEQAMLDTVKGARISIWALAVATATMSYGAASAQDADPQTQAGATPPPETTNVLKPLARR